MEAAKGAYEDAKEAFLLSAVYRELPPTKIKPNTRVSPFMIQMFCIFFSCFFVQINTIFKLSCTLMKYSRILSFDLRFLLSDLWVEVCHFREPSGWSSKVVCGRVLSCGSTESRLRALRNNVGF